MIRGQERLEEIFRQQVFELCGPFHTEQGAEYYIPYMMNDAVESYLILKNCRMVGQYLAKTQLYQEMQLASDGDGYVLVVRQGKENAFTLYFKEIEEKISCYRYHEIGHFWVEGQEQWRQLVYMLGTIHDKYEYLGSEVCNTKEMELLKLAEFSPLREWSPIHESLEEYYPETLEGIEAMRKLAEEAGDITYLRFISLYEKLPCRLLRNILKKELTKPRREELYLLLHQKISEASGVYPDREYPEEISESMQNVRKQLESDLKTKGFTGNYPVFTKGDIRILATEELPFTIMEWEEYRFRIQLMISKCPNGKMNSGFFRGKNRKGWIEKYEC